MRRRDPLGSFHISINYFNSNIFFFCHISIIGTLSDETWTHIEHEILKFKNVSEMPESNSNTDSKAPQIGHSQSDIFVQKQSVSDKMVADCVESLIGTYVFVSL